MSTVTQGAVAREEAQHCLVIAEGLLAALDAPRGLEHAAKFLGRDELEVEEAQVELERVVEEAKKVHHAHREPPAKKKAPKPLAARLPMVCPSCGASVPKGDTSCSSCGEALAATSATGAAIPTTGHGPAVDNIIANTGAGLREGYVAGAHGVAPVKNADAEADDEAGDDNEADDIFAPPNLREADGIESCANCIFFNKNSCVAYGRNTNGTPELVHAAGYPVERGDVCDAHQSLIPLTESEKKTLLRRAEIVLREEEALASASTPDAIVRAQARLTRAHNLLDEALGEDASLEELGIHVAVPFNALKHPRSRGQFSHIGGHIDSIEKLEPGQTHRLGAGAAVRRRHEGGYHVLGAHNDVVGFTHSATQAAHQAHALRHQALGRKRRIATSGHDVTRLNMAADLAEVKSDVYPGLDRSPKENWVDKAGGLPRYIERIAKHVHYEHGKPIGRAIQIAVGVCQRWCSGGQASARGGVKAGTGGVSAATRAKACAAVAEWEAKKKASKAATAAKNVAEWHDELAMDEALALYAADLEELRILPPSLRYTEKIVGEVERAHSDWADWQEGVSPALVAELTEGLELVEGEHGLTEGLLGRIAKFKPALHPRTRRGEFRDVLDHIATHDSRSYRWDADPHMEKRLAKAEAAGVVRRDFDGGNEEVYYYASKPKTVEDHFADVTERQRRVGKRQQASPVGGHDELAVDHAIGEVIKGFPNVKDWNLEGPNADADGKHFVLHVALGDGKAHKIRVGMDGAVSELSGPKPAIAAVKPAANPSEYEPTGEHEVVSHMQPGQVFKGADGHLYKLHGDEWIMGAKGKVKAAHLENLDTGTHKNVPFFAIHGKDYELHQVKGAAPVKPAAAVSHPEDAFSSILGNLGGSDLKSLSGKNVVITGVIPGHTRTEAQALLSAVGAHPQSSVTTSTHVLVTGDKVGATKINAASKKGVQVVPWSKVQHLLEAQLRPEALRLVKTMVQLEEATSSFEIARLEARKMILAQRLEERDFTRARRMALAAEGKALPNGSYPIENEEDLHNAEVLANSGHGDVAAAKALIAKRAAELGIKGLV